MIARERLEELIKQGESASIFCTVWNSDYGEVMLDDKSEICYSYYDKENKKIAYTFLYALTLYDNEYHDICLEDTEFFETEEEMDWYLEFGNITRTETLSLPTWEEIQRQTNGKTSTWVEIGFLENEMDYEQNVHYYYLMQIDRHPYEQMIVLWEIGIENENDEVSRKLIMKLLYTKDNYIKACRLAKKLFLGESIDENSDN